MKLHMALLRDVVWQSSFMTRSESVVKQLLQNIVAWEIVCHLELEASMLNCNK